jgi:hypothetical protein
MIVNFVKYLTATGEIIYSGHCPTESLSLQISQNYSILEVPQEVSSELYYVSGGVLTLRPPLTTTSTWNTHTISANNSDLATFGSSIPSGTVLSLITPEGAVNYTQAITDGIVSIKATFVGTSTIRLSHFPNQDYYATIEVVEVGSTGFDLQKFKQTGYNITQSNASYVDVGHILQIGFDLGYILDQTQAVDIGSYIQTTFDITQDSNYNQLCFTGNFYQTTGHLDILSDTNYNQLVDIGQYIQNSSGTNLDIISDNNLSQLYLVEPILQIAPDIISDSNMAQAFALATFKQTAPPITSE